MLHPNVPEYWKEKKRSQLKLEPKLKAKATPEKESFSPLYMSSPKKLQLVSLDVGGKIFKTKMETLTKYPDSALARMFTDPVIEETLTKTENGEYFLDVDPEDFEVILKFLRLEPFSFLPSNDCRNSDLLPLFFQPTIAHL